jgi:hypothetical protein
MADVYRAEVYYQIADGTVPPAASYGAFVDAPELAVTLVARDQTGGNTAWFSIVLGQRWNATGPQYLGFAECRFGTAYATDDKSFGGTLLTTLSGTAADFLVGGTLVIEKDEAADQVRFTTPVGNYTNALSTLTMQNANAMYGEDLYTHETVNQSLAGTTVVIDAFFRAFWTAKNGIHERGASLAAVQPGVWTDATWAYVAGENIAPKTQTQQTNEDEIRLAWNDTLGIGRTRVNRHWTGGNTIALFERELDMEKAPEHGIIFRAFAYSATPDILRLQKSFDSANAAAVPTWSESVIRSGATLIPGQPEVVHSPNIAWFGGKLYAVWGDGENIVQTRSFDLGETWEQLLSIILKSGSDRAEWPRFIVSREHGLAFYFYRRSASGNLLLRRSGDFGLTFTEVAPLVVFAGIDDEPFDAFITADGFLRVRFHAGGFLNSYYSADLGVDWTAYEINAADQPRLRSVYDPSSAFTYHVYRDGAGPSLLAYASPDAGVLPTPGFPYGIVVTPADMQTADIEILPDGGNIVSYFSSLEALLSSRSHSFAQSWT